MKCGRCQSESPPGSKFCLECGGSFAARCERCGTELPVAAKFCNECGQPVARPAAPTPDRGPLAYTPKHLAEKILTFRSALEGERKQVTVLFADVKGSMDLAEQVDPEEWHHIMDRFFTILSEGVHRFEGTVNQYTGDGIMALFGAPIAHEDHARRACYAALHLTEELRRYGDELRRSQGLNFAVRMGINSGEVVVGRIGDDLRMDYTAQGHTVGLAARVEQLAAADKVYLTEHTAELVSGFFRLRDMGPFSVKGVSDPLKVYDLEGVGPLRTRLEVAARRGLVRFVGRHGEMEQLRRAWEAAQAGHGQIVGVMGEAGIGKSRLFHEFKVRLQPECLVLEAFSASYGKAYAYLPVIELLKTYFDITLEDDERRRREKIGGKVLMLDRALEDILPYLFALLGITEPTAALQQMDAQIRRRRTIEAIVRLLVRETLNQPLVLIFEDLHWVDGETQAFLDVLADSVVTAKILLLANHRPEYQHAWASKMYYSRVRLDPLGNEEAEELLTALLGNGASATVEPLRRLILEKTEGNPFFMEEVVQTLAEEGVLIGERGHYHPETRATELHIPATVQGVLAARIDRLPSEEKALLQTLAVIGKEFTFGLVRNVVQQEQDRLHQLLSHLQAAEFVYEQPAFPEPRYTFKHALAQEVAYESVLIERRKVLHERTAQTIEDLHRDGLDAYYSELAHHYSRTENTKKAVEYLHLAGQQAVDRSAYEEAIRQFTRCLELIATLPETEKRNQDELLVRSTLGPALMATRGYAGPEVEEAYTRARELLQQVGETPLLFSVLSGLEQFHFTRAEHAQARELAEQLLSWAERQHDTALHSAAALLLAEELFWRGELNQGRERVEECLSLRHPERYRSHASLYVLDPVVAGFCYDAWLLMLLGYMDRALTRSREALSLAQELSHSASLAFALLSDSGVHGARGDVRTFQERAEAAIALATEQGFPDWLAMGTAQRAQALAAQGQLEESIAQGRRIIDAVQVAGVGVAVPWNLAWLAEAYGNAGRPEEGLALVDQALHLVNKTEERVSESNLYRVKGWLLLALSKDRQAQSCFYKAIEVARCQSAKSYELCAATSLARLWQKQGKKEEARQMLSEIYGWFTEGFDTRDLREAKALLDELT